MLRIYDYQCLDCEEYFEVLRDMEEVYNDVTCPTCGAVSDGKKAKRILSVANLAYRQGKLKGRMTSKGR